MPALPFCHRDLRAPKPLSAAYPKTLETLGDQIRKRRLDLGLLQKDAAKQLGVSTATLLHWEKNVHQPAIGNLSAIRRFLGTELPKLIDELPIGERLRAVRKHFGWSHDLLAKKLGIDPSTVLSWERNSHRPTSRKRRMVEVRLAELISAAV